MDTDVAELMGGHIADVDTTELMDKMYSTLASKWEHILVFCASICTPNPHFLESPFSREKLATLFDSHLHKSKRFVSKTLLFDKFFIQIFSFLQKLSNFTIEIPICSNSHFLANS